MFNQTEPSRLLRYKDVTRMVNLSRSTIKRMEHEGEFPRSFSVGSRAVAFDRDEILEWIRKKKLEGRAA